MSAAIDLTGQVALVTGAARGIGAAIARAFAAAGADVVVADIDEEGARRTAESLKAFSRRAQAISSDIGAPQEVSRLFETVRSEWGRLDVLINNAGVWLRKRFLDISASEWDQVVTTNLKGTFLCTQEAARIMIPQKSGCIVNIASHAGLFYSRGQGVHYAASKAGIIQMTRVLAFELGPHQLRINAIAPGGVNTNNEASTARSANPLGRRGEAADIANAALFLASPMASFVTGQTLVVNGGSIGSESNV